MNIEQLRDYCLSKKGVNEGFPFDDVTLAFKVLDKIFLLTRLKSWEESTESINLKCDPDYAQELRAEYSSIRPGFHMNKKHWNTIYLHEGELQSKFIISLIDHSYNMVVKSMSKSKQEQLKI